MQALCHQGPDHSVAFSTHGTIGVVTIDNPPVNALSGAAVAGLNEAVARFEADRALQALVIQCAGRTFVAGGDISSFDDPDFSTAPFNGLLARIEAADRPVVASLHGTALGGGLELAMACHHRVALPDTRVGLPEVKLGLVPGSLGTQRLPRLVGAEFALEMISSGRMVDAATAQQAGILDVVLAGDPLVNGIAQARALVNSGAAVRRVSTLAAPTRERPEDFFAKAFQAARAKPQYPALEAIVRCVEAAVTRPFEEGEKVEAKLFEQCRVSPQSQALRHLFFAERAAGKIPGLPRDIALRPVRRVGVLGAGTMGGGIAMSFANAGFPVTVLETSDEALQRGLSLVRRNYEASAAKGKLSTEEMKARMALLHGTLDEMALAECDLVIEAVFEDLALKRKVCAQLGAICKPGAIIATNTSTLDVDVLAGASGRAADVLGMHFFSPANVMRLIEVVRGAATAADVLATVMGLASAIGKVPVVSGVCFGFIGNRMGEVYMREAEFLLLEGASPAQIDSAVEGLGMAMGPCRMLDMAGIDVGAKTVIERGKEGGLPDDPNYRVLVRKLFALGRFGQKSGAGYYRYEGRAPLPDPELGRICEALALEHGIVRRADIAAPEIVERLLYPLINEGTRILEEGIAYRSGDIDVVWVSGYGFPDHRGGPMFMADALGLQTIVARLAHYATVRGNAHGYWTASPLLVSLAAHGKQVSQWSPL